MSRSEECQKRVIPDRADVLAQRLFDALSPMIDTQARLSRKPNKMLAAWKKDRRKLREIFETALRLKVKTMTGDWVYEIILPASGATFQEKYMRTEEGRFEAVPMYLALAPGICCFKQQGRPAERNSFRCSGLESDLSPAWIYKAAVLVS